MADDLLGGVLGGEDEQPETEAPQALAGAEAFAAAVAAIASRQDPGVARKTEAFLDEQTLLLETQRRHLEDEHASRLTHLRLTVAAAKRKRYADHVRNYVYTGIALIVLGVLAAAARMTVEAMSDHSLVVADFTVPSDFAARGISSQALAEDLASRVAAIRATANGHSLTYSSEVRADPAGALKVQIPETGISVDELERFLHRWLGHQTVINGELREAPAGTISLVLHIAGSDPIAVRGSNADLDGLMQTAAEKAFAIFDPVNDVIYLVSTGRPVEAYDAAASYARSESVATSSRERADAYSLVAGMDPDRRRGLSRALIAIDIDPRQLVGWMEASELSSDLGHDQAAVRFARKWIGTKRRDQLPSQQNAFPWLIARANVYIDQATGDFTAFRSDHRLYDQRPGVELTDSYAESAEVAALLHDEAQSREDLARALAAGPSDLTVLQARWDVSSAAGDWAQALEAAKALVTNGEAQKSAAPSSEFAARAELELATQYRPLLAYAEAMTGDVTSATALISQTPTDCYLCVRMRARIAAAAADAAAADRWFAEAVRQAPELPMAYYEWGQALLARGDLAGAAREFSLAHEKGPHFADALNGWGAVLAKQGHRKDALGKYDEALKYAPSWAALKQARAVAAGAKT
ncbi:MAG: hypothetical protein WBE92_14080 [Steroidobacteraceae bacterium]